MTTPPPKSAAPFALRPQPHLYEINTWAWLESLSSKLGRIIKLADVPDSEWDALARRGFDIVWLMGVWQRSPEARRLALTDSNNPPLYDRALPGWKPKDVVASPYSVAAYVPDPRIGSWQEVDAVREKLHARGVALFFDFVGNHTALDHPWTREHPDFYVQATQQQFSKNPGAFRAIDSPSGTHFIALARDPYFPPWSDCAQLNHFNPAMRAAQIAELRIIASHCDGVRCDMAMLHLSDIFEKTWAPFLQGAKPMPREFWADVHSQLPNLILLAEAYWGTEQRLLDLGFSFAYDKSFYDSVRDMNAPNVRSALSASLDYQNHLARFLENHDEHRAVEVFGKDRMVSVGTLMGTIPGMRFYHQGELEGLSTYLPITLQMAAPRPPDTVISRFFEKLLRVTNEDVFHHGSWNLLPVVADSDDSSGNLIAHEWRSDKAWKVIVVNLSGRSSQGRIQFGGRQLSASEYVFYDELNEVRYLRDAGDLRGPGVFVRRDGFGAHLFDVCPVR
ncbi:MAG: alpha-amylase family glycosyl hydrolase [Candidatus Acidiferrales bacterium]